MTISLFRSTKEPDVFGFTVDPTGSNLPAQLGPWQSAGDGTAAMSYAEMNRHCQPDRVENKIW